MQETEKIRIQGLYTQWTSLCEYLRKIDTEHWYVFTFVFAAFGFLSLIRNGNDENEPIYESLILLAIMVVFYYEAYRLREVAVLKGYLSNIEKQINEAIRMDSICHRNKQDQLSDDAAPPFGWFSAYEIVLISKNNRANTFLAVPIMMTLAFIYISCIIRKLSVTTSDEKSCIFWIILIATLIMDMLAMVSIMKNLSVSKYARNSTADAIIKKSKEYDHKDIPHFFKWIFDIKIK
ncbi:MAG: hypothetical protein IJ591_07190 [Lachnospiraceae bacterium]|nr:hypothetical protein [Lachnospiraceae bacterium]